MGLPITLTEPGSILMVGGGAVACRKLHRLLEAFSPIAGHTGAPLSVDLIAPDLHPDFRQADGTLPAGIYWRRKGYTTGSSLAGYDLIFACTDQPEVNRQIAADARAARRPVNVADAPELCTFFVPATLQRGEVTVAFSAGGAPALAASLREEAEDSYPAGLADYAQRIRRLRQELKERYPERVEFRHHLLRRLCAAVLRRQWLNIATPEKREEFLQTLLNTADKK